MLKTEQPELGWDPCLDTGLQAGRGWAQAAPQSMEVRGTGHLGTFSALGIWAAEAS